VKFSEPVLTLGGVVNLGVDVVKVRLADARGTDKASPG
jgi:hypothetical protein